MANYQSEAKSRKRNVGIPAKPVAAKATFSKTIPEKMIVANPHSICVKDATAQLINSMDLDEMLEASKLVEMGIKGEKITAIKSSKAQRYAVAILLFRRSRRTKPMAEKMMHDLNVQIIKVNKQTTDAVESKRLYRELMAEE